MAANARDAFDTALARLAWSIDRRLDTLECPEPDFGRWSAIELYHASTPDHARVFLEQVLHEHPGLAVRVTAFPSPAERVGGWAELCRLHDVGPAGVPVSARDGLGGAVLLFSPRAPAGAGATRLRRAFARESSARKLVIDGDGSIWGGGVGARLMRKALRLAARWSSGGRERYESRCLAALSGDPGYDPGEPPPPPPGDAPGAHWRRVMDLPVPLDQDRTTGTLRRRVEEAPHDPALYEGAYHGRRFIDERRDWGALARQWQGFRAANLQEVGALARPPGRALDIGCGTGLLADLLDKRGWRVDACDVSRDAVARAAETFPGVRFRAGSLGEVGFSHGAYDLVTLSHVIEHVVDDVGLLRSAAGYLSSRGVLYVETTWMDTAPLAARSGWVRQRDHVREYSKRGLWAVAAAAGLDVLAHSDSWRDGRGEPYQFLLARRRIAG